MTSAFQPLTLYRYNPTQDDRDHHIPKCKLSLHGNFIEIEVESETILVGLFMTQLSPNAQSLHPSKETVMHNLLNFVLVLIFLALFSLTL